MPISSNALELWDQSSWISALAQSMKSAQATRAFAVTPNNSTDLATTDVVLYIGGAGSGNLKVTTSGGDTVTFAGVGKGFFPIRVNRVWSTGTDVTNIMALY
jgi:hypothetical protein